MSDTQQSAGKPGRSADEDKLSALFAQLIMQQANMAMMLLGKISHPETGEVTKDLDAAQLFIDELEMLEVKTSGNLTKQEAGLLKQSLMSLRLAFVEAVEAPTKSPPKETPPPPAEPTLSEKHEPSGTTVPEEEHRKKFTKKY